MAGLPGILGKHDAKAQCRFNVRTRKSEQGEERKRPFLKQQGFGWSTTSALLRGTSSIWTYCGAPARHACGASIRANRSTSAGGGYAAPYRLVLFRKHSPLRRHGNDFPETQEKRVIGKSREGSQSHANASLMNRGDRVQPADDNKTCSPVSHRNLH